MVLLLAGGRGFPRREGLRRIKERLENAPGLSGVRYEPSRIRPRTVVADVDVVLTEIHSALAYYYRNVEGMDSDRDGGATSTTN